MSLFKQLEQATTNRDANAFIDLMSDDCVFVRHQSGTTLDKSEISELMHKMMAEGGMQMNDRRLIYENDDILVVHSVIDYPDQTKEAVLSAYSVKDGKITKLETGATPLTS